MAIAEVRGVKANNQSAAGKTGSLKPELPTGAVVGDLIFVLIVCLTKTAEWPKVTTPEGWTRVGGEGKAEATSNQRTSWLYYKEYDGSGAGFLPTFVADKESANQIAAYCLAIKAGTWSKTNPVAANSGWTLSGESTNPKVAKTTATLDESLGLVFTSWSTTPKEPEAGWADVGGGTTTPGTDAIRKEAEVKKEASTGEPTLKKASTTPGLSIALALPSNAVVLKIPGGGAVKVTGEVKHEGSPKVNGGGRSQHTGQVAGEIRIATHGGGTVKLTSDAVHGSEPRSNGGGAAKHSGEAAPDLAGPKIVQRRQTSAGAPTPTLTGITACGAGHLMVAFIPIKESVVTPTLVTDNLGGVWTIHETHAIYKAGANSFWLAYKAAAGGETEVKATAAGVGVVQGIAFFEIERASTTVDTIAKADNGKATTGTTPGITTTNARDLILAAFGGEAPSGVVEPWTGTGPMINSSATTTRVVSGSLIPGAIETGAAFTGNWTNSINFGTLVVAFLVAGVIRVPGGGSSKRSSFAVQGGVKRASTAGSTTDSGEPAPGVGISVHGGGRSAVVGTVGAVYVHGGGNTRRVTYAVTGGQTIRVRGGGATGVAKLHTATVTGGGSAVFLIGHKVKTTGGGRSGHAEFLGPPDFPEAAPRAGRMALVHTGRREP